MDRRRLLPLGLAVTALVVLAGIASHGRPLAGGRGAGPTASFFDYVLTTILLFGVAIVAVELYVLASGKPRRPRRVSRRWHIVSSLLAVAGAAALATLLLRTGFIEKLRKVEEGLPKGNRGNARPRPAPKGKNVRNARVRWDEVAIVAVLVGGTVVLLLAGRKAKRPPRPWRLRSQEAVSLALDESLDDLRSDPDLRRAIIGAYARMERALAHAGLPRNPAEAPFEYVERALLNLDTSSASARRLTGLFEWAKFSQHEPEPEMRDEAIAALVAVRDELRRPAGEPVTV